MQATIQKWGNSQGIRIPKAFLEAVGMGENDLVEILFCISHQTILLNQGHNHKAMALHFFIYNLFFL